MKKLLPLLMIILAISFGCTKSKHESVAFHATNVSAAPPVQAAQDEPNSVGYLLVQGKLLKMKPNGSGDEVTSEVTLSTGAKISKDGKIIFPDGKKMTLTENALIQPDGTMPGNDPLIPDEEMVKGFQLKEGKVLLMTKDAQSSPLLYYMKLKNETVVEPDGTLIKKDGTRDSLKEGEMILVTGQMAK